MDVGLSILSGSSFVLSDRVGDIVPDPALTQGFFGDDTRFISGWRLRINGTSPQLISVAQDDHFSAQCFLSVQPPDVYLPAELSIIRRRAVADVWVEELLVLNHAREPARLDLRLDVEADFADLFEVKDGRVREREISVDRDERGLVFVYRSGDFVRESRIAVSRPAAVVPSGFHFQPEVEPREEWSVRFIVQPHSQERGRAWWPRWVGGSFEATTGRLRDDQRRWMARAPRVHSDWHGLERVYLRSVEDLAALRFRPDVQGRDEVPAAGLPWFMALFGRDSILASLEALPFFPELAEQTLTVLAKHQGRHDDPVRDEEPGKILHELRRGELTATGALPYSPYYGTADATPLFLILLDEHRRWSGDDDLARRLEGHARAALDWIDRHGDLDGDGFVEYQRRNEATGLENQCWKDSWDSIRFRDGSVAQGPVASCEIQGYVFDAKLRAARLAQQVWGDPALAERLRTEAGDLRDRFHDAFWIEERAAFALALDGEKRQVDSVTSNLGHLLWSGIVRASHAPFVAGHLMAPHLFTGWGLRTISSLDDGFNPIGYHTGTVWPHDTALGAAGLARYGFREAAATLADGLIRAGWAFGGRLPETFAGYASGLTRLPVDYPTSASPQAWAAAAPMLLLRIVLGLEPDHGRLTSDPVLPREATFVRVDGLPVSGRHHDVLAGTAN